jgi:hypothetical protein
MHAKKTHNNFLKSLILFPFSVTRRRQKTPLAIKPVDEFCYGEILA